RRWTIRTRSCRRSSGPPWRREPACCCAAAGKRCRRSWPLFSTGMRRTKSWPSPTFTIRPGRSVRTSCSSRRRTPSGGNAASAGSSAGGTLCPSAAVLRLAGGPAPDRGRPGNPAASRDRRESGRSMAMAQNFPDEGRQVPDPLSPDNIEEQGGMEDQNQLEQREEKRDIRRKQGDRMQGRPHGEGNRRRQREADQEKAHAEQKPLRFADVGLLGDSGQTDTRNRHRSQADHQNGHERPLDGMALPGGFRRIAVLQNGPDALHDLGNLGVFQRMVFVRQQHRADVSPPLRGGGPLCYTVQSMRGDPEHALSCLRASMNETDPFCSFGLEIRSQLGKKVAFVPPCPYPDVPASRRPTVLGALAAGRVSCLERQTAEKA